MLKLWPSPAAWNVLPNGRKATFFNLWTAKRFRQDRFRVELREDLGHVMDLLAQGAITAQIAARFPLAQAAEALRFAEGAPRERG